MKNLTLKNLQTVTGGKLCNAKEVLNTEITSVVSDSRKIREDCLFLCIKGEKADGHDFAAKAVEDGALAVVCERKIEKYNGPYLLVESVLKATQEIAEFYRMGLTTTKVVGITGSVGKTSTKEFVSAVLSKKYRVRKTKGNLNNQWGVPFTIFDIKESDEVAVIEMGIGDFGEMDHLAKMVRPDIAVITNIGQSHLEFFKTRDGILKEKSQIFNYMTPDGSIILNGDDDKLSKVGTTKGIRPRFYGLSRKCDICAENIVDNGFKGVDFDVVMRDGGGKMSLHVSMPIPGKQMVYNALAATLVGLEMDVAPLLIKNALEHLEGTSGRNNVIKTDRFTIIDDCYNASPASMESALDLLKTAEGRKVAVLGDMFELGEDSDKYHFQIGKKAGENDIDLIICVGDNSEKTFMGAKMSTDKQVEFYRTVDECLDMLKFLLKDGDTVLVKASNGMNFSRIVESVKLY
ncbi:MAG: UDP-N-acetylmuramoyl-tripeptide--D-alanyl-D-alanine ligase [Lachnospiraceae bacterium]|nr:UDP-N-acetylmuramoyl-tripeptide--D-alanyl-D-alanine ligase [Lachnospiraceae bacterium]